MDVCDTLSRSTQRTVEKYQNSIVRDKKRAN